MSKKLFVGNLSFQTAESEISSAFETYGSVESVSIITDRETGRSKGFGFVVMSEEDAAEKAIDQLQIVGRSDPAAAVRRCARPNKSGRIRHHANEASILPQAGNQLLALTTQQLADLTAVVAAHGRAQNLESAQRAAAQDQGREQLRRFLTQGAGYQSTTVQMFH